MEAVEDANFSSLVKASPDPVAVVFFSEWCTTCKEMMPIVEEMAAELKGQMKFCKIDFDENTASAVECGVLVVPTIVLFKDGKALNRIVGFQLKAKLREKMKPYLPKEWLGLID